MKHLSKRDKILLRIGEIIVSIILFTFAISGMAFGLHGMYQMIFKLNFTYETIGGFPAFVLASLILELGIMMAFRKRLIPKPLIPPMIYFILICIWLTILLKAISVAIKYYILLA